MTENSFPGPMSMIQIDGQKIKSLREQQGLTQLYLATAVDVTTDTISRWENKRYPSIKTENGIRLAEALSVTLEEILENKVETVPDVQEKATPHSQEISPQKSRTIKQTWPILLLSGTLLGVVLAFMFSYFQSSRPQVLTAKRIAPEHCIIGQPFPVIIELSGESDKTLAFILKEKIPAQAQIVHAQPEPSGKISATSFLKWITKAKVPTSFSYLIQLDNSAENGLELSGTIATAGGSELPISGSTKIRTGLHHWADTDTDNIISDKEILTIYDQYSGIQVLEDEIDRIEEIWLGDGYRWNTESQHYDIIE
ncbi:MAG: transcriptional regulator with XRE-family HTH domain [Desulforhopalus sp.]|jgi:transcriptional regulator with XRE-family HTH domain